MSLKAFPRAIVGLALVTAVVILLPPPTNACGPFFTDAIFVFTKHPDFPLEQFANGKLGVLSPSWARSYLVVAYRNLSGAPLTQTEAKDVKSLWEERLNLSSEGGSEDWSRKWNEARAKVPGTQPVQFDDYRNREKPNEYESLINCQQDALKNADPHDAENRFNAILKDNTFDHNHHHPEKPLNLTKLHLQPAAKLQDIAYTIAKPNASNNFKHDV